MSLGSLREDSGCERSGFSGSSEGMDSSLRTLRSGIRSGGMKSGRFFLINLSSYSVH